MLFYDENNIFLSLNINLYEGIIQGVIYIISILMLCIFVHYLYFQFQHRGLYYTVNLANNEILVEPKVSLDER